MKFLKVMHRSSWAAVLLVPLLAGVSGCEKSTSEEVLPSNPVVKTQVLAPTTVAHPDWYLSGTVGARYVSNLSFRVAGKITQRLVNVGDEVQADQPLFTLDPTDYALSLNVASASIRSTESEITNAKLELARLEQLLKRNLTSAQNVDQATSALTVLQERLKSQILQEQQARNQLAYTQLKSPGLGKMSAILAEKGEVVSAGMPVATLVLADHREVTVQVPENRLSQLTKHAALMYPNGDVIKVALREVATQADPISRTWTAHYGIPADAPALALGQTARVVFHSAVHQVRIPSTALYEQGDFTSIWRVENGQVNRVPVEVTKLSDRWAWIEGDLTNVKTIVTLGVHQLNEGQQVRESAE